MMAAKRPRDENTAGTEGVKHEEDLKASDEAVTFMSCIEPAELQKCVFLESLVTMSESGRHLGNFSVSVKVSWRVQQPCILLQAQSQGVIDGSPCGTTVTTYINAELEVLEEDQHEYIQLEDHSVDKRWHLVQRDEQMVISKVTRVGEEETKETISYPTSVLRGLVTEGSSLLLMRLFALKKNVPENMTFISLDQQLHINYTTFSELGVKQLEISDEVLQVFGAQRTVQSVENSPAVWQCYFLDNGRLASRQQVGSPVIIKLLQLSPQTEAGLEKMSFAWEEDLQMLSEFTERKEELKADYAAYLRQHPEIRALLSDFLQSLLIRKPEDVFQFAREYFLSFKESLP